MSKDRPWKYQELADVMMQIHAEDECNDTYGRIRMYQVLKSKQPEGIRIPSERTVYRIMEEIGLSHHPNHKSNGITKADRQAQISEDLLHRDFHAALNWVTTHIKRARALLPALFSMCGTSISYLKLADQPLEVRCELREVFGGGGELLDGGGLLLDGGGGVLG